MPAIVLLGAQWGDEGRESKATDLLGGRVRMSGALSGGNRRRAHRRLATGENFALHLIRRVC